MCAHQDVESGCCCSNGRLNGGAGSHAICPCGGSIPRHFILPATLLLLDEEPSHGYALLHKLSELGITDSGMSPATVYRVLSRLEEEGLAVHEYSDGGQGPTRKVYSLTDEGRKALEVWRSHIEKTRDILDWFADKASREQAS